MTRHSHRRSGRMGRDAIGRKKRGVGNQLLRNSKIVVVGAKIVSHEAHKILEKVGYYLTHPQKIRKLAIFKAIEKYGIGTVKKLLSNLYDYAKTFIKYSKKSARTFMKRLEKDMSHLQDTMTGGL